MAQEKITLIGAGLVGSLLAVFLARRGYLVDVFEWRPDMRKEDVPAGRSINLALANRGIHTLKKAGLMDQIEPLLTTMKGRMIHDLEGNQNLQPYGQRPEEVIYSVSRAELNKVCMKAAEETGQVNFHFNKRCLDVDFDSMEALLRDESSGQHQPHSFTRIIGTDGSASAVRGAIFSINTIQHNIENLGHSYKELHIPPDENGNFRMPPNALHIWPRGGFMLIALPNTDRSFTVTLFMPKEGPISFAQINTEERLKEFFSEQFKDTSELIPNLTQDYFNNPTGHLGTIRCRPWHYKDRALVIGDAAHAIVPFHGQGMNCGFEDVSELDRCIEENTGDWEQVFRVAEELRRPNAEAIADMAIENYVEMRDSVRDPKFVLRKELAFELEKRWPDRFIPRYSMVMFHRLPYTAAKERGVIQSRLLEQLTAEINEISECDFSLAEKLVMEQLEPVELNPS